jgi:hypothetical protein
MFCQMLASADVKLLQSLMSVVRDNLGQLPVHVTTNGINAYYVESVLMSPGDGNSSLCTPFPHSFNVAGT